MLLRFETINQPLFIGEFVNILDSFVFLLLFCFYNDTFLNASNSKYFLLLSV